MIKLVARKESLNCKHRLIRMHFDIARDKGKTLLSLVVFVFFFKKKLFWVASITFCPIEHFQPDAFVEFNVKII